MTARKGVTGTDLIARRVLLLQHRAHIIVEMGDLQDPTWTSSWELTSAQIAG